MQIKKKTIINFLTRHCTKQWSYFLDIHNFNVIFLKHEWHAFYLYFNRKITKYTSNIQYTITDSDNNNSKKDRDRKVISINQNIHNKTIIITKPNKKFSGKNHLPLTNKYKMHVVRNILYRYKWNLKDNNALTLWESDDDIKWHHPQNIFS